MNLEWFIAKRLILGRAYKNSISAPIIKIAIAAIALGMVMMLIAIASGVGMKLKIREKVAAFNGHIQISNYDNNLSQVSVEPVSIDQDFYPEFSSVSGISHVQAVIMKGGIIRNEETFEGILAKGVGTDFRWDAFREYLVAGDIPDYTGKLGEEVLISKRKANRLQLQVSDSFRAFFLKDNDASKVPNNRVFKVSGIYDSGFEEFDENIVFVDRRHLQRMNKWEADQIGHFEVFLKDFDALEIKTGEVYQNTSSYLDTRNIQDKYNTIFEWIGLFDFNIAIIIGIMVLVGGINMITALLVLILERTTMIGLLKALGGTNWSIRKVFLYNAAYLIFLGLLWGNILGLGIIYAQSEYRFIRFPNPEQYYIEYVPVHLPLGSWAALNIGVLLLCLAMLLLPSLIISKIAPVKAIRFA
ncbi:ABC transporter permease [Aureicoccus marinus]|uniref:Transmembrane permease n=1 Tax=Aureicoccus marinus TaxID=754435 RepID=A0A2S7T4I4_9FLAO|nr:FtsX-like permease family protein [Aureicoccus marinus]PQJ14481.1 transmembrane permease [Aureicoccus marinus]